MGIVLLIVQLTHNKLHMLKVYNLMSFDTYIFHEIIITIKIINISIAPKVFLMPLTAPPIYYPPASVQAGTDLLSVTTN